MQRQAPAVVRGRRFIESPHRAIIKKECSEKRAGVPL
jgi:hypothetical protein